MTDSNAEFQVRMNGLWPELGFKRMESHGKGSGVAFIEALGVIRDTSYYFFHLMFQNSNNYNYKRTCGSCLWVKSEGVITV